MARESCSETVGQVKPLPLNVGRGGAMVQTYTSTGPQLIWTDGTSERTLPWIGSPSETVQRLIGPAVALGSRLYLSGWFHQAGYEPIVVEFCPGDFDFSGSADVHDVLAFFEAFSAGNEDADLDDGSGSGRLDNAVTIDDLLFFVSRWSGGC